MNITVTPEAVQWFKRELHLNADSTVRFFVKYGGDASVQQGFSLGINVEAPKNVVSSAEIDGVRFFVRDEDAWYFENRDLHVSYHQPEDDIVFSVRV